tara:strand:- start:114 stop:683 length:570 start_codon:yes stop_codon:yes gene_type:complete
MQKQIILKNGRELEYTLRQSKRAKRIGLSISGDGSVVLTAPVGRRGEGAENFLFEKTEWLTKHLDRAEKSPKIPLPSTRADYLANKEKASDLISERVEYFNQHYGYRFKEIKIKNQKTRWGSCSSQGNLNFNFRILFLPKHLRDYIVVHELCHLKQMNHSQKFWDLVAQTIPDHKAIRTELRNYSLDVR